MTEIYENVSSGYLWVMGIGQCSFLLSYPVSP